MKEIKYIWNITPPKKSVTWQMLVFTFSLPIALLIAFGTKVAVSAFFFLGLVFCFKREYIGQWLDRLGYFFYAIIHFLNLVLLSTVYLLLLTPMGLILKKTTTIGKNLKIDKKIETYFEKGELIVDDHFERPY